MAVTECIGFTMGISNFVSVSAPENDIVTDCCTSVENSKTTFEAERVEEVCNTDKTLGT
jgi:hypothetical protein